MKKLSMVSLVILSFISFLISWSFVESSLSRNAQLKILNSSSASYTCTYYGNSSFSDDFYYFEIKDKSRPLINPEDYKFDKTLKGEFIRAVMADSELSDGMKARVISCGINALLGEELFGE